MENDLTVLRDLPTYVAVCLDVRAQRVSWLRLSRASFDLPFGLQGFTMSAYF